MQADYVFRRALTVGRGWSIHTLQLGVPEAGLGGGKGGLRNLWGQIPSPS